MDITKTDSGYTLNTLTINGKELDRSATYSFLIYGDRDWWKKADNWKHLQITSSCDKRQVVDTQRRKEILGEHSYAEEKTYN